MGARARAARFIHDRHWHLGQAVKAAKTAEEVGILGTCPVCKTSLDSQEHWLCRCPHHLLQDIRTACYAAIEEKTLLMSVPLRYAVRDAVTPKGTGSAREIGPRHRWTR